MRAVCKFMCGQTALRVKQMDQFRITCVLICAPFVAGYADFRFICLTSNLIMIHPFNREVTYRLLT